MISGAALVITHQEGMTIQGQSHYHYNIIEKVSKRGKRGFQFGTHSSLDCSKALLSAMVVDHCPTLEIYFFVLKGHLGKYL